VPGDEAIKLPFEPGNSLMIKLPKITEQLKCTLVGVDPNISLIVRLPSVVNNGWNIQEQMGCVVRFLAEGIVFGFNTYVLAKLIKEPLRYLFLAYPSSLEQVKLRKSKRVLCHLPARLTADSSKLDGVILDVGAGGLSFVHMLGDPQAPAPNIHLGMEITISMALWGASGEHEIKCQVRNINMEAEQLSMGLSFTQKSQEAIQLVIQYVDRVSSLLPE
jgi:c-di-GMP-binding flagellar brake protein YcgR